MPESKLTGSDAKLTITATFKDGRTETFEFDCDDFSISQETGYEMRHKSPNPSEPPEVRYNGHQRINIKAWKGCGDFDSFVGEESYLEVGGFTHKLPL